MAMRMINQSEENTFGVTSHEPQKIEVAYQIAIASNIFDRTEHSKIANLFRK